MVSEEKRTVMQHPLERCELWSWCIVGCWHDCFLALCGGMCCKVAWSVLWYPVTLECLSGGAVLRPPCGRESGWRWEWGV